MTMTVNGISTTKALGQEQYEEFTPHMPRTMAKRCGARTLVQYDYRHTNGKLFSCTRPTLEACRSERDKWIANQ